MLPCVARWSALAAAVVFLAAPAAAQVTFTSTAYHVSHDPTGIATGDFNHNDMPDVAIGFADQNANRVEIFLATAPGQYGAPTEYPISRPGNNVVADDFNGDDVLDILT